MLLCMLNCKVNSKLYATHVFHKHHLLPLFATTIATVKSILQTSQLHFCTWLWQYAIDRQTKYLFWRMTIHSIKWPLLWLTTKNNNACLSLPISPTHFHFHCHHHHPLLDYLLHALCCLALPFSSDNLPILQQCVFLFGMLPLPSFHFDLLGLSLHFLHQLIESCNAPITPLTILHSSCLVYLGPLTTSFFSCLSTQWLWLFS